MRKVLLIALGLFVSVAQAQMEVPAIERTAYAVPVMDMPPSQIELTPKEEEALKKVREWKKNPGSARRSPDGTLYYQYGVTMPTIICTPYRVCALRLQPGETVNQVKMGDTRWIAEGSVSGSGNTEQESVIVKTLEYGISTNMIVSTDRRTYTIELKSARHEWMPAIAFDYPEEQELAWAKYRAQKKRAAQAATLATGENAADLDFRFTMSGDNPKWKPLRVYRTAEGQTYIQFASDKFIYDAPVLVVIGKGGSLWSGPSMEAMNYRPIGDRYKVDGIPDKFALISGVGDGQTIVNIEYTGGRK